MGVIIIIFTRIAIIVIKKAVQLYSWCMVSLPLNEWLLADFLGSLKPAFAVDVMLLRLCEEQAEQHPGIIRSGPDAPSSSKLKFVLPRECIEDCIDVHPDWESP